MSGIGLAALAVFIVGLMLVVRSMLKLRGWADRSRLMSIGDLARRVLPRTVIPLLLLWATYHVLAQLVMGRPTAFNFRYIGAYYAPEAALLLALAIAPALAQAAFMTSVALFARLTPPRLSTRHEIEDAGVVRPS